MGQEASRDDRLRGPQHHGSRSRRVQRFVRFRSSDHPVHLWPSACSRLPSYLAFLSTLFLHPLLSSTSSPDAVAGATAVRDVSFAVPASASAEAAESEVLISDPANAVGQGPCHDDAQCEFAENIIDKVISVIKHTDDNVKKQNKKICSSYSKRPGSTLPSSASSRMLTSWKSAILPRWCAIPAEDLHGRKPHARAGHSGTRTTCQSTQSVGDSTKDQHCEKSRVVAVHKAYNDPIQIPLSEYLQATVTFWSACPTSNSPDAASSN